MKSEDNLEELELVLSFCHVHAGNGTQVIRLDSKHFRLLRHVSMSVVFEIRSYLVSRLVWNHVEQMLASNSQ